MSLDVLPSIRERAIVYVRQSTAKEESISPATQREHCMRHAAKEGYEVVDVVEDLDLSGRNFKKRSIGPIINRVRQGEATVVITWKWSRWGRNLMESLLCMNELKDAGGKLESATEPIDASTSAGKFSVHQLLAIAELQSDQIGESWRDAQRAMLRNGLPPHGGPRLGYLYENKQYTIHPVVGPVLRNAYEQYVAGLGFNQLTRQFRELGIKTTRGVLMGSTSLAYSMDSGFAAGYIRLVKHSRLLNDRAPLEEVFVPSDRWEPIIDKSLWEAYRQERAGRRSATPRSLHATHALSGIPRCAGCGAIMGYRADRKRWTCQTSDVKSTRFCPIRVSIADDELNAAVLDWLTDHRDGRGPALESLLARKQKALSIEADIESHRSELERQKGRLSKLIELAMDGSFTQAEIADKKAEIQEAIEQSQAALDQATSKVGAHRLPPATTFGALLEGWEVLDPTLVNRGVKSVMDSLYVYPFREPVRIRIRGTWDEDVEFPRAEKPDLDFGEGRVCLGCKTRKGPEQFNVRRRGGGQMLSRCKECRAAAMRDWKRRKKQGADAQAAS